MVIIISPFFFNNLICYVYRHLIFVFWFFFI